MSGSAESSPENKIRGPGTTLAEERDHSPVPRVLTFADAFAVQFSLIALASSILGVFDGLQSAGPSFFWAWVLGGALQLCIGISIARITSAYPVSAPCYQAVRQRGGGALAWMVGYLLIVGYLAAAMYFNHALAPYLLQIVGVTHPTGAESLVVAVALLAVQSLINVQAISFAALISRATAAIMIAAIAAAVGALLLAGMRQEPLFLFNSSGTAVHEHVPAFLLALLQPAGIISTFDSVGNLADEVKSPRTTVGRGVVAANLAAYILGLVLIAVPLLAVADLGKAMHAASPLVYIIQVRASPALALAFEVVAMIALFTTSLMLQASAARALSTIARQSGVLGAGLLSTRNKNNAPTAAVVCCAIIAGLPMFWAPVEFALGETGTEAWAAGYGITIAVFLLAELRGRRLSARAQRFWDSGTVNDTCAVVGSLALVVLLPIPYIASIPIGIAATIGIGLLLYRLRVYPRVAA